MVHQVATVTCAPNADVTPIHHRMAVILEQTDIEAWLKGAQGDVTPLMRPWPEWRLSIEPVKDVDWDGT